MDMENMFDLLKEKQEVIDKVCMCLYLCLCALFKTLSVIDITNNNFIIKKYGLSF